MTYICIYIYISDFDLFWSVFLFLFVVVVVVVFLVHVWTTPSTYLYLSPQNFKLQRLSNKEQHLYLERWQP